jgi:RimJ/RimL family protein N-acetyltransferase
MILTPRLRLDPLRVEDADEMADVLADPSLYRFTGGRPPTLDDLRRRYATQVQGGLPGGLERWLNWVVRLRADPTAIGYVQATVTDGGRRADLAWVVGTSWQGHGFAAEAASGMADRLAAQGARILTAHIRADHAASAAVARRIGLVRTDELEDGEQVWRLDIGARDDAKQARSLRLNLAVGAALIGFAGFELVMARTGQLPRSADQLLRDLLLAAAGVAMLGYGIAGWVRRRRSVDTRPAGGRPVERS